MVKTLVLSFGTLSLAALGAAGLGTGPQGKPGVPNAAQPKQDCCAKQAACCASEPKAATIECDDSACVIRFTTDDGRAGTIEIACKDGECKVTSCTPCGTESCCDTAKAEECCAQPEAKGTGADGARKE